jgi:hypothetical protein
MADLVISNELKVSKEELLLGDIVVEKVGCGAFRTVHGLLANDLSVKLQNGMIIPLLDYIGDNNQVLEHTLRLVGASAFALEEGRPVGTLIGNLGAAGGTPPYVFTVQDARFRTQSNRLESNYVFDYETDTSPIQLDVKVTDSTGVYTIKNYTVSLEDVVEAGPIVINAGAYSVNEHSANGTTVGTINVTGGVAPYTMSLSDTSKFYLDNIGVITVNGDIEYDNGSTINIDINVTDSAGTTASRTVPITINEVANTLHLSVQSSVTLEEHTAVGTLLTTATATGGTTPYTYSMSGTAFDIDPNSGAISPHLDLEYDNGSTITSTVTVTDNAGDTDSSVVTFTLTEEVEILVSVASGSLNVNEHQANGTEVCTLAGTGGNGNYTWSSSMTTPFAISNAGVITVTDDIERDTATTYSMPISVTDGTTTSTDTLTLNIVATGNELAAGYGIGRPAPMSAPAPVGTHECVIGRLGAEGGSDFEIVILDPSAENYVDHVIYSNTFGEGITKINLQWVEANVYIVEFIIGVNSKLYKLNTDTDVLTPIVTGLNSKNLTFHAKKDGNVIKLAIAYDQGGTFGLGYYEIDNTDTVTVSSAGPTNIAFEAIATSVSLSIDAGVYCSGVIYYNDGGTYKYATAVRADDGTFTYPATGNLTSPATNVYGSTTKWDWDSVYNGVTMQTVLGQANGIQVYNFLRDGTLDSSYEANGMQKHYLQHVNIDGGWYIKSSNVDTLNLYNPALGTFSNVDTSGTPNAHDMLYIIPYNSYPSPGYIYKADSGIEFAYRQL